MQRLVLIAIASYTAVALSLIAIVNSLPASPHSIAAMILGVMLWPLIPVGYMLDTMDHWRES